MAKIIKAKINKHYNKFVIGFIVLAIIIVIFTGYFAFAKTTIIITPQPQKVNMELVVAAVDVDAKFATKELNETFGYDSFSMQTIEEDGYAIGTVTIYNEYVADQTLVATTRLLSKDGVLFRTQENTVVPKGGSVEVSVKADQIGKSCNIGPSEFEIVALNSVKKSKIYAKSSAPMTGGIVATTIATEDDINSAKTVASESLLSKAFEEFSKEYTNIAKEQISMEITKQDSDATIGQKTEVIGVRTDAKFSLAEINLEKLQKICKQKLSNKKGENYSIAINKNLTYAAALRDDQQILNVDCAGSATLSSQNYLIKKDQLTNKTSNQVKKYLENFDDIKTAEIKISPFWVKTTPFIKENIIIEIKDE